MADVPHPKRDMNEGPVFYDIHQAPDGIAGMFTVRTKLTQAEVDSVVAAWRARYGERPSIVLKSLPYASLILPEEKVKAAISDVLSSEQQAVQMLWDRLKAQPDVQELYWRTVVEKNCERRILPEEKTE